MAKRNSTIKWELKEGKLYEYEVQNIEDGRAITVSIPELFGIEDFEKLSLFQKSCVKNGLCQKIRDSYAMTKGASAADKWSTLVDCVNMLANGSWTKQNTNKGMSKEARFREAITPLKTVLPKDQVRLAFADHVGFSEAVLDEVFDK